MFLILRAIQHVLGRAALAMACAAGLASPAAAGQSTSAPDVRVPVTVSSLPVQQPSAPPLQQVAVQPAPQAPQASAVKAPPPVVHDIEATDQSMPGPLEAALMLLGGAFALVIPVLFWRQVRA